MDDQEQQVQMSPESKEKWESAIPLVEELWAQIFEAANKVLSVHLKFGFHQFTAMISPNIHDTLLGLKAIESVLDAVGHSLEYSEQRLVMNAKQQIWSITCLGEALKHDDETGYNSAIEMMTKQSKH